MYYESVITLIDKLTKMLSDVAKKFKQTKFESAEMTLRKTVDATGTSGRNLADVFGIYDYPTLFRTVQQYARNRQWGLFEVGDYIIIPNININGANYANIRFILTGINSYDGIGNAGSYIPGLVFSAYNVLYNDTWLNICDNDDIINNAANNIANGIGQNLNSAWHYNSQRRQAFWKSNSAFILSEQELSNPMRSYTIGNTHSNHMLPLYKRSSLSKYRYNLSNNPSPFWLSNKDQYNSLYLEAVYRQGWQEAWSNKYDTYNIPLTEFAIGSGPYGSHYYTPTGKTAYLTIGRNLNQHHGGDHWVNGQFNNIYGSQFLYNDSRSARPQYTFSVSGVRSEYTYSSAGSHISAYGSSQRISIYKPGDIYYNPHHGYAEYENTDYKNYAPMQYKFSDREIDTITSTIQHCRILTHANNDWGDVIGIFDGLIGYSGPYIYEWQWGSIFDHYNYHYEMGALYQEINKLSINSLYNTSSGVTFSIYA